MKNRCLILVISILLFSCSKNVLDRTIFIPDEDDDNLPAYTEWGYNSFGAEYERDYFRVSNKIIPCKIVSSNNQLQFLLSGTTRGGKEEMSLLFIFPATQIKDYKDLILLNNTTIDLSQNDCEVKIIQNNTSTTLDIVEGDIYFKRTQLLSVDDVVNRTILSGTFDIRFLQNGFPTTISNGRFDLGITKNVFSLN